jgi:hypothetical protein
MPASLWKCQGSPFAITCGLAGWFVHTVFFANEDEAQNGFTGMRAELDRIIACVPSAADVARGQWKALSDVISDFVKRYQ